MARMLAAQGDNGGSVRMLGRDGCPVPQCDVPDSRIMSVRIPEPLAIDLEVIARFDDVSLAEAIRQAVTNYIQARLSDSEFQDRARRRVEFDQAELQRLAQWARS